MAKQLAFFTLRDHVKVETYPESVDTDDFTGREWKYAFDDKGQVSPMAIATRAEANEIYPGVNTAIIVRKTARWLAIRGQALPVRLTANDQTYYVRAIQDEGTAFLRMFCVTSHTEMPSAEGSV